jgi:hypothetical protein
MVVTSAHAQVNGFMSTTARWHVAETSSANAQAFLETWTTTLFLGAAAIEIDGV